MLTREDIIRFFKGYAELNSRAGMWEISSYMLGDFASNLEAMIDKHLKDNSSLSELRLENIQLKAENEIYRRFLTSSNYKLPKLRKEENM